MFYIEKDAKIILFDSNKDRLRQTLEFMPEYADCEVKETNRPIENFQFADIEEYRVEQIQKERIIRLDEIKAELEELDKLSQRASRAVALCIINETTPNPDDIEKLTEFENRAETLRGELQGLEASTIAQPQD